MRILLLTAVACCLLTQLASAQIVPQQKNPPLFQGEKKKGKDEDGKTRSLSGVVKDEQEGLVESGVVQLKDTKSLQVRSFITKEDGKYYFHGLSTDVDYQVKAERKGMISGVKTLSVFDSRKEPVINLKLDQKK
jgi:hypothetical protein